MKELLLSPDSLGALLHQPILIDEMYQIYKQDPGALPAGWLDFFEGRTSPTMASSPSDGKPVQQRPATTGPITGTETLSLHLRSQRLIEEYRSNGHKVAHLDPLKQPASLDKTAEEAFRALENTVDHILLEPASPDEPSYAGKRFHDVLSFLKTRYCGSIGYEYTHVANREERLFWMNHIEGNAPPTLPLRTRQHIWKRLFTTEALEKFIHTKFVGAKRFSLEGGESLVPLLDALIEESSNHGTQEILLGMAHRGRLNVLVNVLGKPAKDLFCEFEDIDPQSTRGKGDVKYHMGYDGNYQTQAEKTIRLSLAFNPSHLEAVNPVVLGRVRAKQQHNLDTNRKQTLGILIHGDAAFVGQGIVSESLNLSQVEGYRTGGTIHVVINNQVGFTTSPEYSRSSRYCTDIAKMIQAPVLHVNGDDPEAVVQATRAACLYQQTFQKDVVLDLVCFRRYGHNESDEPSFTQPTLYHAISTHPSVATTYGQQLVSQGVLSTEQISEYAKKEQQSLEQSLEQARTEKNRPVPSVSKEWESYTLHSYQVGEEIQTHISMENIALLSKVLTEFPTGFSIHPKVARLLLQRKSMLDGNTPLDWGMGELLAFGSLLVEGFPVRLTGQDSRRGTFSQRHAAWVDTQTNQSHIALEHVPQKQMQQPGAFSVFDSTLSEAAVVGFEYGYSLESPQALVLWEAQFGDFVNGSQIILDQFLSSSEAKWSRLSGLVLLLPHGYEGQGPEHSSARFERFLQMAAQNNIHVVYPTTPAQYFHLLRRQIHAPWRKPLVVMTPKSLLRHPLATSALDDFTSARSFKTILAEDQISPNMVQRILLCTGKIYYDLVEERTRRMDKNTAIVRIEQLYPLDTKKLGEILQNAQKAKTIAWVQEEPENMGALAFIRPHLRALVPSTQSLHFVSRPEAASPATGSHKAHGIEQRLILDQAFSV